MHKKTGKRHGPLPGLVSAADQTMLAACPYQLWRFTLRLVEIWQLVEDIRLDYACIVTVRTA